MELDEALRFANEWYPTDPDADEAPAVLAGELEGAVAERQRNSRDDGWQRRWVGPWVPEDDPYQGVSVADE